MTGQLSRLDATVLPIGWAPPGRFGTAPVAAGNWSPALSPDGRHAAYVSDRGGSPCVWVQPVGADVTFAVGTGPDPVVSVAWSPGGGWLACVLAPGGAPRTEVWLVRPDGSDLHQVAGFGTDTAFLPRWLPGSGRLVVTENSNRALVVEPATGSVRTVAEGDLIALLDLTGDGRRALLRRGPRGARRLAVLDLTTGTETPLVPADTGCFSPDGAAVYARADDVELARLVRVEPCGAVTVVAERADAELDAFTLSADGTRAALVWNTYGGASELALLDVAGGRQQPVSPLPGAVVEGCAFAGDGGTLAFAVEGPAQPRGVWVTDCDGVARPVTRATATPGTDPAAVSSVTASVASVTAAAMAAPFTAPIAASGIAPVTPELHRLRARDGLTLSGWLYRPAGPGPYPAVVSLHAGPEAQERPGWNPLYQSLVSRGIAVFAPNVRGSSGFGRTFVNADNLAGRYGAIDDVAACVTYLVATGVAEPGRIGCMGRSYGGYLTLAALVAYPELFAAGVDTCGMANFVTFYAHTEPWIAAAAVGKYGHPVHDRELLRDLSPITHMDRLAAPLLVVHGAADTNVPVCEAEQVVAALRARGVPHRYLLFADEGHEFLSRANREAYVDAMVGWLAGHLRAAA
jgi:dipeptidyl aminopeptidase/acylaminoacyl peptidase